MTKPTSLTKPPALRTLRKSHVATLIALSSVLIAGCGRDNDEARAASATTTSTPAAETASSSTPASASTASSSTSSSTEQDRVAANADTGQSSATVVLDEEKLNVEKREVDQGGVLIRKEVETRQVNQPVELERETIDVEHLTPEEAEKRGIATTEKGERISEGEVFIPLQSEEAVVQKEVQPREVVRAETDTETQQKNVDATLRREVVDIERQGAQASASQTAGATNQTQQLEERIRSELRNDDALALEDQQIEEIDITIDQNQVTLAGTVPDQKTVTDIEQKVRQVEGVNAVQNQLRASSAAE